MGILAESVKPTGTKVMHRKALNEEQIGVLEFLSWHRFTTSKVLALYLKKPSAKSIQDKLKNLEDQSYIGKRYDKSYRLIGKPAAYYLTPSGMKVLERLQLGAVNAASKKLLYKNKTVSLDFIDHRIATSLVVMKFLAATHSYHEFNMSPQHILTNYEYMPSWRADLLLTIKKLEKTWRKIHYIDVWDGTKPFFVAARKMINYVHFLEKQDFGGVQQPVIIGACKDQNIQRKLNSLMKKLLRDTRCECHFATILIDELDKFITLEDEIFSRITGYDKPVKTKLTAIDPDYDEDN